MNRAQRMKTIIDHLQEQRDDLLHGRCLAPHTSTHGDLEWACTFYSNWYRDSQGVTADNMAYQLVSAIRAHLAASASAHRAFVKTQILDDVTEDGPTRRTGQ